MTTFRSQQPTSNSNAVTFAHWWGHGDGAGALNALLDGFKQVNPTVDVEPSQLANLSMEVKSSILKEKPPDVWVEWPGANMHPYNRSGTLAGLTEIWETTGLKDHSYNGPESASLIDDEYFSIPLNIHRVNNLFYNPHRLEDAGINVSRLQDPYDLLDAIETFDDDGQGFMLPLKDPWTALQLWETLLLGITDARRYEQIMNGNARQYEQEIQDSFYLLDEYREYAPDGALFMSLTDANEEFQRGGGVFYQQGDWVAGAFGEDDNFEYGEDWDVTAFPGTEQVYDVAMDALMVSKGALERDSVRQFVEYVASPEALRRFNLQKGSVPPRNDVRTNDFPAVLKQQQRDFSQVREQPLSLTHGLAVSPDKLIEIKTAIASFLATGGTDGCASDVVSVLSDA